MRARGMAQRYHGEVKNYPIPLARLGGERRSLNAGGSAGEVAEAGEVLAAHLADSSATGPGRAGGAHQGRLYDELSS